MFRITLFFCFLSLSVVSKAQDSLKVTPFTAWFGNFQNVRDFCISKDHSEVYFTIQSPMGEISQLACMRMVNYEWTKPELLAFCDENMYMEPFLSEDGKRLYFASDRHDGKSEKVAKNFDIWYVERESTSSQWSEPINMGKPVNSDNSEFYPTFAKNGNLYFTMDAPTGKGKDDIYFCAWNGKKFAEPVLLGDMINSNGYEFNAFISPDESFLFYTKYNAEGGYGSGDLYIARKDASGNWQKAENLGDVINTKYMEYCPFYDELTRTLYFTSKRNSLEPKDFDNIDDFQRYVSGSENGLSQVYWVEIGL